MKSQSPIWPVVKAAEIFCERWTPLILWELACGASRFAELQRGVPPVSPALLSRRLRQLEAKGVVERHRSVTGRSWTYHLTPAGEELVPLVEGLASWGQRWSRRNLANSNTDLGFVLLELESNARPGAFGNTRTVVELEVMDQPMEKRWFWFLNDQGRCELWQTKPCPDVALYIASTLSDLICLWRGDLSLRCALESGRLVLHGQAEARHAVPRWLFKGK